jgi:hypothetical protein
MNVTYRLQGVTFEWDEEKARTNVEKHGITFEEAAEAFFDPFCQGGERRPNARAGASSSATLWPSVCSSLCTPIGATRPESSRHAPPPARKESCMSKPETPERLHLRSRPSETVALSIPSDTIETIRKVAASRDMSPEALLKLYIGHGLRHDAARLYSDRILAKAAEVLARHISSEEERTAILQEIKSEAAA